MATAPISGYRSVLEHVSSQLKVGVEQQDIKDFSGLLAKLDGVQEHRACAHDSEEHITLSLDPFQ